MGWGFPPIRDWAEFMTLLTVYTAKKDEGEMEMAASLYETSVREATRVERRRSPLSDQPHVPHGV